MQTRDDSRKITEDNEGINKELQTTDKDLQSKKANKKEMQSTKRVLSEAQSYAEAIIAAIRQPVLVLDEKFRVKTANTAFCKRFQISKQETQGKLFYDLSNKQWNIPALRKLLEEILPEKRSFFDFEVNYNFPSIGQRTMLLNGHEIIRERSKERLILLAIEDVTEQKEKSEALEKAVAERTRELQEANESLQEKNQQIALSKYNKRFLTDFSEKYSSYKLYNEFFTSLVQFISDTIGLDFVFVGELVQTNNKSAIQTIALNSFGQPAENINYPLPDGPCEQVMLGELYSYPQSCRQTFPKHKTIAQLNVEGYIGYPLFNKQENPVGLIAVMHKKEIEDPETVSSILKIVAKRAEIELERIKFEDQLEQNNASLLQKNEELIKINKELESFAHISSHDLQEPLRKIQTFATLILEKEIDTLSDKGKNYFHRMQESAMRMQTLIQDLLSYSRTSYAERKFKKVDLNKVVEEVKNDLKEIIDKKNATIEAHDLCKASIIPFQFHQMMYNLISNSLKYSDLEKPPHIIIKTDIGKGSKFENEELSSETTYCKIIVSDNGIGFDPVYQDKIFEVFQRLHGKNDYPGTGIGLSIVKKIVENHNGFITATGKLTKGATFNIYLPT